MTENITISDQERAGNVAFQIKQLLIRCQNQIKPELVNAITLMEHGVEGVTKESVNEALGDSAGSILTKCKSIADAI